MVQLPDPIDNLLPDSNIVNAIGGFTVFSAIAAFGVEVNTGPINPVDYQEQGLALLPILILLSYLASDRTYGTMNQLELASLVIPPAVALSMGYVEPVNSFMDSTQPLSGYVLIAMSVHAFYNLIVVD